VRCDERVIRVCSPPPLHTCTQTHEEAFFNCVAPFKADDVAELVLRTQALISHRDMRRLFERRLSLVSERRVRTQ
jgi:hypothetical protein